MLINLLDNNISYIIIECNQFYLDKISSVLYSKDYTIMNITSYDNNQYKKNILAITSDDNNTIRKDSIFLIEQFDLNGTYVKYNDEKVITYIDKLGKEYINDIKFYDNDINKKQYLFEGISFTINKLNRYYFPKSKGDLKNGLVVEIYNNNNWIERDIHNIDIEYDRMYKLLMKYEKVRIKIN